MKVTLLLLVLLCTSLLGYSQRDFRKGFIVTANADTIHGMVKYSQGSKAVRSCYFKKSEEQNSTSYSPGAIKGYGFEGDKVFVSHVIEVRGQNTDTVFIEVLVRGLISLYRYEQSFFVEKGPEFSRLDHDDQVSTVDGNTFTGKSTRYIGTLTIHMADCPRLKDKISRVSYNERSLTGLVENYNACVNSPMISYKAKKRWMESSFGLAGGMNFSTLKFTNTQPFASDHMKGPFSMSRDFMLGISVDLWSPRINERISFHGDLFYLNSTYTSSSQAVNSSITTNHVTINLTELKVPLGIRYTFPERNFTPFFNFGVSGTIHLKATSDWVKETYAYVPPNTFSDQGSAWDLTRFQFGIWAGVGVAKTISPKIKGFLELRWERTDGVTYGYDLALRSNITNIQVVLGIRTHHKK